MKTEATFRSHVFVLLVALLLCEVAFSQKSQPSDAKQEKKVATPLGNDKGSKNREGEPSDATDRQTSISNNDNSTDNINSGRSSIINNSDDDDTNNSSSISSSSNNNNNNNNNINNVLQSTGHWVAGVSNCSCVRELTSLKRDLRDEINQRLALKAALDTYVSELYDLRNMVTGTANSTRMFISPNAPAASNTPSVAFSSKLSYNRELKPLDTVIFDTVLTNDGNAYDPDTGKFTAIVTGTYLFHATVLSGYNTKVETAIIVNDKEVARIYSGAHDAHGSGSNMAIVDLRSGDSVWVRLLYQGGNHVHGYYSTFSGALIKSEQ